MSTRSNIFVDFNGERKQFYHHHDGYIEGVGADLLIRMGMAVVRARNAIPLVLEQKEPIKSFLVFWKKKVLMSRKKLNFTEILNISTM